MKTNIIEVLNLRQVLTQLINAEHGKLSKFGYALK